MKLFQRIEVGFDSTAVDFRGLTGLWAKRLAEIGVDAAEWNGDLQAVPTAFDDPAAAGHDDDIDDGCIGLSGEYGDAFVDAVARSARAIDGKIRRAAAANMLDKIIECRQAAIVATAAATGAANRDDADAFQAERYQRAVLRLGDHRGRTAVAAGSSGQLLCVENRVNVGHAGFAQSLTRIVVHSHAAGPAQQDHEEGDCARAEGRESVANCCLILSASNTLPRVFP